MELGVRNARTKNSKTMQHEDSVVDCFGLQHIGWGQPRSCRSQASEDTHHSLLMLQIWHRCNFCTDTVKCKHQISELQEYDDKDQPSHRVC